MIEVQIERDIVVEADVLRIEGVALHHACRKCDDPPVLAPEEEAHLVPNAAPQLAEIVFRQLLEVQLRALIDLQIQRIDLRDHRRYVVDDDHLDRGGPCRGLKFLAQLLASRAVEGVLRVIIEACVFDAQSGHRQAWDASEAMINETVERRSISRREFLEYDQLCAEAASMSCN